MRKFSLTLMMAMVMGLPAGAAPKALQKDVRLIRASSMGAILFDHASWQRNGKESSGNIYLRALEAPGFAMMTVKARCLEGTLVAGGVTFVDEDGKTTEAHTLPGKNFILPEPSFLNDTLLGIVCGGIEGEGASLHSYKEMMAGADKAIADAGKEPMHITAQHAFASSGYEKGGNHISYVDLASLQTHDGITEYDVLSVYYPDEARIMPGHLTRVLHLHERADCAKGVSGFLRAETFGPDGTKTGDSSIDPPMEKPPPGTIQSRKLELVCGEPSHLHSPIGNKDIAVARARAYIEAMLKDEQQQ